MARIRAVVFDAGGTLLHPAHPIGETYARFASKHGVTLEPEATTAAFRQAFRKCLPRGRGGVPRNGDDRVWWKQVVRHSLQTDAFFEAKVFEDFFEEVYLYYAHPEAWGVYPEVRDVLSALRDQGVTLAVLSNWDARLHQVIDGHGLGEYLPNRFISAELGWEKPEPEIYTHVSASLELPSGSILSVGDERENDVEAPQRAGWQGLLIDRPVRDLRPVPLLVAANRADGPKSPPISG